MSSEFSVSIEQFAGPLDLMLHLIKENKLDLFALDILELANQYIAYIKAMEELNLEIASEYLVELAGLIEYKSKRLLPKEKAELEDNYEGLGPDELVARLIEYSRFKEASKQLEILAKERQRLLEKPASSLIDSWVKAADTKIEPMAVYQLLNAMERCRKRLALLEPLKIETAQKTLTIDERIEQLQPMIAGLGEVFTFEDLCYDADSLMLIIMTFLAVLELLKNQVLTYKIKKEVIYFYKGAAYAE